MERLSYSSRCALVVDLIKRLRERGSWCGETHLQKAFLFYPARYFQIELWIQVRNL